MGSSLPLHKTLPPVGKLPESPKLPGLPKLLSDLHAALPFFCPLRFKVLGFTILVISAILAILAISDPCPSVVRPLGKEKSLDQFHPGQKQQERDLKLQGNYGLKSNLMITLDSSAAGSYFHFTTAAITA